MLYRVPFAVSPPARRRSRSKSCNYKGVTISDTGWGPSEEEATSTSPTPAVISIRHPTLQVYVDESGIANQSRFMAFGALVFRRDHGLFNSQMLHLRDRLDWRSELHFVDVKRLNAHRYREAIRLLAGTDARFVCLVVDKEKWDPFESERPSWKTHAQLTVETLAMVAGRGNAIMSVVVDNISTPVDVNYEGYIATSLNRSLRRLGAAGVNRMDSRSCSGLQMADVLTGAVVHQHRRRHDKTAREGSAKGQLADFTAQCFNLRSFVGARTSRFRVIEATRGPGRSSKISAVSVNRAEKAAV